jgi:hypothetical protein
MLFIVYTIHTKQSDPSPLKPILNVKTTLGSRNRRRILKHNYPKSRKPNENSVTQILLKKYGEKDLYNMWVKFNGMYKMSDHLSQELGFYVSPYVVRYLSNKLNWVRTITDKSLPLYLGIQNGRIKAEYYKHLQFE